jgi:F-type H+-transporting ATPase subunit b
MLIDWFTVIAQVVNFLILVWLLKRFLYRPILNAIDAREKRIAAELASAESKKADALKERDEFMKKNKEFEQQRHTHINQMKEEVKTQRLQLLDSARQESDELRSKQQDALRAEQRSLSETLTHHARDEVFAIARKALTDLAGTTLEERMTEIFIQRLHDLNESDMAELKAAFKISSRPLIVRTVFILPAKQCLEIETAMKKILGEDKEVKFETVPDLVSGIEISADGRKVAWSISDYLQSLGKSFDSLLKSPTQNQNKSESNNKAKTKPNFEEGVFEDGA